MEDPSLIPKNESPHFLGSKTHGSRPIATIMAVYSRDDASLFSRSLQSILDQRDLSGFSSRIYLAIDGPIPPSIEEVIEYNSLNIFKILRIKSNQGLANALNCLIASLEDEELIFRMDADDFSLPERYISQIRFMDQNPNIDILGTAIAEVDLYTGAKRTVTFYNDALDLHKFMCRRVPVAHPSVCIRRHVFEALGGYPLAGTNEDVALWFICAKSGYVFSNIQRPLLEFTVTPDFWRRRNISKAFGELKCYAQGIYAQFGPTWRLIFPLARFFVRLLPPSLMRIAYQLRPSR